MNWNQPRLGLRANLEWSLLQGWSIIRHCLFGVSAESWECSRRSLLSGWLEPQHLATFRISFLSMSQLFWLGLVYTLLNIRLKTQGNPYAYFWSSLFMQLLLQYPDPQCPAISASQISISSTRCILFGLYFPELQFENCPQAESQDECGAHLLCFPPLRDKLCILPVVQLPKTVAPEFCPGLYLLTPIYPFQSDAKLFDDTVTEAQVDFITQGYFIVTENFLKYTEDNSGLFK